MGKILENFEMNKIFVEFHHKKYVEDSLCYENPDEAFRIRYEQDIRPDLEETLISNLYLLLNIKGYNGCYVEKKLGFAINKEHKVFLYRKPEDADIINIYGNITEDEAKEIAKILNVPYVTATEINNNIFYKEKN